MRVLFVCTGNICRSAFAEGLARTMRPDADFASAGTHAIPGNPATHDAIMVADEFGVDLRGHSARPLHEEQLQRADHAYGASQHHVDAIESLQPGSAVSLLHPAEVEIADPYGESADFYRLVFGQIQDALATRLAR